jgi:hypothetical protein
MEVGEGRGVAVSNGRGGEEGFAVADAVIKLVAAVAALVATEAGFLTWQAAREQSKNSLKGIRNKWFFFIRN